MGHKVDPRIIRLKITDTWKSRWFARGREFARALREDNKIRSFIKQRLPKAGIFRVDIERPSQQINVTIHSTRPGMIIGRGGVGVEELKKEMQTELGIKIPMRINIEESKNVNLEAKVWADTIAEQLEKRMAFRRAMKNAIEQIMDAGAVGVKIAVSGRLGGSDIARTEWLYKGKLPLHTLRSNIDFARSTAMTTYGTIGVKVWINKGEVFDKSYEITKEPESTKERV